MLKSKIAAWYAKLHVRNSKKWKFQPQSFQQKTFEKLIQSAKNTAFGKEHGFESIRDYEDFKKAVPIRDYEGFKPYIERAKSGEHNVFWPGKPLYWAKTSGTTSGTKYIPISKESMPYHIKAAKSALLHYIVNSKNPSFVGGKMIFLQGSPELEELNGIPVGRLSGIVAHYVPKYLQKNRLPSWKTNCIEDWETKVDTIVEETITEDMRLISGIPPWLIMYFEKLITKKQQPVGKIFQNLQLLVTGGVNYEPYRQKIHQLIGREIDIIQTFPASEGFFAFQDQLKDESLLLLTNHGIFYEFVPLDELEKPHPKRITLNEIELQKDYAMIITTNAGLWAYDIGDVVRFISKDPYRIMVTGRTKHYTSAFGEHVIAFEVEEAMRRVLSTEKAIVSEFTVAPLVNPVNGLPHHEWYIEFEKLPENIDRFAEKLDTEMCKLNTYYNDLVQGKILKPLEIKIVREGGFISYMKSVGKLGGQNKLPRLSNNRTIAEFLIQGEFLIR